MPKLNPLFACLVTLLLVSAISNYALYKSMVNKSNSLIKSEQAAQLSLDKNKNLSGVIESMKIDQIESQLITDELQNEVVKLNQQSEKVRIVIKEKINNAACYSERIHYPDTVGMHYD